MLIGCACLSAVALAVRLDTAKVVVPRLEQAGELAKASEREIVEAMEQAGRVALVGGVAKAVFVTPLAVLALAAVLKLLAWVLGKRLTFAKALTVASVAALPLAVFHLLLAAAAFATQGIAPAGVAELLPSSALALAPSTWPAKWLRLVGQLDFFNLWAAVLLGVGFAAGTKMSVTRGLAVSAVLYISLAVVLAALPGLSPAGGR